MRDTGIIVKDLSGDPEGSTGLIGIARTQAGILKNQMRLGGLDTGARNVRLSDGSVMRIVVAGGITRCSMYYPPGQAAQEEQAPSAEVPQEEFQPPVLTFGGIRAGVESVLASVLQRYYFTWAEPAAYNGRTVSSGTAWFDISSKGHPCTFLGLKTRTGAQATATCLTLLDADGVAHPEAQPTSWTANCNGVSLSAPIAASQWDAAIRSIGLKAGHATALSLPYVIADSLVQVTGTGGARAQDSQTPLTGYIDVLQNSFVGANITGPSNIIYDTATYYVWLNGVALIVAGTTTGVSMNSIDITHGANYVAQFSVPTATYNANPSSFNPNLTFGGTQMANSGGSVSPGLASQNAWVYHVARLAAGHNGGSGVSTFVDAYGNQRNVSCSCDFVMTLT